MGHALPVSRWLLPVPREGLWGFTDQAGEWRIAPRFRRVRAFSEGAAAVSPDGDLWGLVNENGEYLVEPHLLDLHLMAEGLCAARTEQGWGYVDATGSPVSAMDHTAALAFREGFGCLATSMVFSEALQKDLPGEHMLVDHQMREWGGHRFDCGGYFSSGMAFLQHHGVWRCYRRNGTLLVEGPIHAHSPFSEGFAGICDGVRNYYIDLAGRVQFESDSYINPLHIFSSGLVPITMGMRSGYLDTHGQLAIDLRYRICSTFSDGLGVVQDERGGWGAIDCLGQIAIECGYDELSRFIDGIAEFALGQQRGYLTHDGRVVTSWMR